MKKTKHWARLLSAFLLLAFWIALPVTAARAGYVVRYEVPKEGEPSSFPSSFLYGLLKEIDITVAADGEFVFANEKAVQDDQREQTGNVSMRGRLVELKGTAVPQTALYGTMSFRVQNTRTTDGVHTYVDFETASVKETTIFTYDGPFYILTSADGKGKELVVGFDPITRDSVDMFKEMYYYNAADEQKYYNKSNEFPPSGLYFYVEGDAPTTAQTVKTEASKTAGETEMTVPAAIVLGVAAAAAGVAGAGAGASGGEGRNEEEEEASTYKMYIHKEFGDAIRYDKPAVFVYARMAEINARGMETERPDLTSRITIFSENSHMRVGPATAAGRYMGATVEAESVKGGQSPEQGIVSFRFTGTGGSFQNNVTFRLVGDPNIDFAEDYGELVNLLEGDNGLYEIVFSLKDFMEEAKVMVKAPDGLPFDAEPELLEGRRYSLRIRNRSGKPEKPKATRDVYTFELAAENEKEYARSMVTVSLYPEGLSVRGVKFDKAGNAQIGAYADPDKDEEDAEVTATRLIVELAVGRVDGKGISHVELVDVSKAPPAFGDLKGTEIRTENLVKAFRYEIIDAGRGAYQFQPKMQIPEMGAPYYLRLPVESDFEGVHYSLDLPVRLLGEPFNEMREKQEELRLLLKRARKYMPPEDWAGLVRFFKERFDSMSAREIRLMDRSLITITQEKLTREGKELREFANTLDWVIGTLEWVKWIGDQAFSYLMAAYTGPVGEALIVPAKEIAVGFIAEYASEIWLCNASLQSQDQMTRGIRSNVSAMMENALMSQVDTKKLDMKKLGMILASFAMLKLISHYFNDVGPDGKPVGFLDAVL
jgi:hypothetical protein